MSPETHCTPPAISSAAGSNRGRVFHAVQMASTWVKSETATFGPFAPQRLHTTAADNDAAPFDPFAPIV